MANSSHSSGRMRYALVFALGILVGGGASWLSGGFSSGADVDSDDAVGTFLPRNSIERLALIDRETIDVGALRGMVETRSGRGIVIMELSIESDANGDITVDFDEEALSPRGFNQKDATVGEIVFRQNQFQLLSAGANRYQLTFRKHKDARSAIQLRLAGDEGAQVIDVAIDPTH